MKLHRPGQYQTKRPKALHYLGYAVCWATHPQYPNNSMNARGRVLHIERRDEKFDYPKTFCGMRVVELEAEGAPWGHRRICLQCETICKRESSTSRRPERESDD